MTRLVVGVCSETAQGERRVGLVPASVRPLSALGVKVMVQRGAGSAAGFSDDAYAEAGAGVLAREQVVEGAGLLVGVQAPGHGEHDRLRRGQAVMGLLRPLRNPLVMRYLADHGITAISVDLVPPSPAPYEPLDAAASQAAITGHEAALIAASHCDRCLPAAVSGCERVRVLVIGSGAAARQAMATARDLGAEVEGLPPDGPTPGVRLTLARTVPRFDIVIVTGTTPAQAAPEVLLTAETVAAMRPGSVIIDTTVEPGGATVALASTDTTATVAPGVTVIGAGSLPSRFAHTASIAYSQRSAALLARFIRAGTLTVDLSDPLQAAIVVTHHHNVLNAAVWRRILDITAIAGLP